MGRCFESIGKKEEARENYYRALTLDRNFTEAKKALQRLKQ
jgi:Tfp pilus assembly protein PilF